MASRGDMLLDRVDGHDRPIGTMHRKDALSSGAGFRVVHVLLLDGNGNLLLQEIAASHERHPGHWGSSVAGYVAAGETYEEAARRKLLEELGISPTSLRYLGKTSMRDETAEKFIGVFSADASGLVLRPNPADFQSVGRAPLADVEREVALNAKRFTDTFRQVLKFSLPLIEATV